MDAEVSNRERFFKEIIESQFFLTLFLHIIKKRFTKKDIDSFFSCIFLLILDYNIYYS